MSRASLTSAPLVVVFRRAVSLSVALASSFLWNPRCAHQQQVTGLVMIDHVVADAKERGEGVLGNYRTLIGGERRMLCDGEGEEGVRYGFVVDTTVSVCSLFGLGTSGIRL